MKKWEFSNDVDGDYSVWFGGRYIGLIAYGFDYSLYLNGRYVGGADKLYISKIKFILKYFITRLFGV